MFDFPNSPSVGQQIVEPNGSVAQWDGVKWNNVAGQVNSVTPAYNNAGRNLLHNSLFNIQQRGAGPFTVGAAYAADRWSMGVGGGSFSVTQLALADADRTAIGDESATSAMQGVCVGGAATTDATQFNQNMEGVRRTAGKMVTVSFWARATAGTPKIAIEIYQNFGGGGGSGFVTGIGSQAFTLSTTWTRYTSTPIAIPSASGKTIGTGGDTTALNFWLSAGSANASRAASIGVQSYTLQLWGVQLEVGTTATPLEKPDPQQDLAKCQRFYQIGSAQQSIGATSTASWTNSHWAMFPTPMRATPTMTTAITTQTNCTGTAFGAVSATVWQHNYAVSGAAGGVASTGNWTASADL